MANDIKKRIEVTRMEELKANMTQKQFEEKTCIAQSSYSKIINNQRGLSAENIVKIAEAFDVSTDWLLGRTNDKTPVVSKTENKEITYGEIIKIITYLINEGALYAFPESFFGTDGQTHILNNTQSLQVNDKILGSILSTCSRAAQIPNDYKEWRERNIAKYSEIPYLPWTSALTGAYNHFFGSVDISPELLATFSNELLDIFKKILEEQKRTDTDE